MGDADDYSHLTNDKSSYTQQHLMTVEVSGVKAALEKHQNATPKGIKVHFNLDDSGFFSHTKTEHLFEEEQEVKEEVKKVEDKKKEDGKKDGKDKVDMAKMFTTLDMDDFKDMDWSNPDPEKMKKFQEKLKLGGDFDPSKFKLPEKDEPAEEKNRRSTFRR